MFSIVMPRPSRTYPGLRQRIYRPHQETAIVGYIALEDMTNDGRHHPEPTFDAFVRFSPWRSFTLSSSRG
jgi:hypothetical protein